MNTREHTAMKMRGNPDISYLGHTVESDDLELYGTGKN